MADTKSKILAAAETLIAENGIKDTTIAAIARQAGVADSHAYQYFKGKEQLLFAVAYERFADSLGLLEEHLLGITESWSKLRKMIWYSLSYNDKHPGYVRILCFECRSNKNYYESPAYQLMRKHSRIFKDILRKGVEEGAFRSDINYSLIRDLVYGVIDMEAISCVATGEIDASCKDLDDIMEMVGAILRNSKNTAKPDKEEKIRRIISAAEKEFALHGYAKAKVTEIAKKADVSEGTVYDYFKNKEELLLSVPVKRFRDHLNNMHEAFELKTPIRKLRRLIRYHFSLYLPNRDFLKVFLMDIQLNVRFYKSAVYEDYKQYLKVFEDVILEGQEDGSFRKEVNPRVFRNMFLGTFSHVALRWVMLGEDQDVDKMKEIDILVDMFSSAVLTEKK